MAIPIYQEAYFLRVSSGNSLNTLTLNWQVFLAVNLVIVSKSSYCQEATVLLIKHYCSHRRGLCAKFSMFGCLVVVFDLPRGCLCKQCPQALLIQCPVGAAKRHLDQRML